MFKKVIYYFIDNSFVVNLITAFLLLVGALCLFSVKRDFIPPWEMKMITISASLPGATAKQVEYFVTYPLEESVTSFPGISEIKSNSQPGSTSIQIILEESYKEVDELVELVKDSVENVKANLPSDVENISVKKMKMTEFWLAELNILNYDYQNEAHRLRVNTLADDFKKIPGVIKVDNSAPVPAVFVKFDLNKLSRFHLDLRSIQSKIVSYFQFLPIGRIEKRGETINVEVAQNFNDVKDLNNMVVSGNSSGRVIRLKDVAKVSFKQGKVSVTQTVNGVSSVELSLYKDGQSDVLKINEKLQETIKKFNEEAPMGLKIIEAENGAHFIQRQLTVLNSNGILGFILVFVTLFVFLGAKNALMTAIGLPLSYMTTFITLSYFGVGLDIISVVGMLLVIGILVDDAIIVAEQYAQYLEAGMEPRDAAYQAVRKTIIPITGAVLTTVVAFLPILLTDSGIGNVLKGIPFVVISALVMSWFECFLILPNHLAHYVKKAPKHKESGVFVKFKSFYRKFLAKVLRFRYLAIFSFVALMIGSFVLAQKKVPLKFDLRIGNESLRIVAVLKESASIEETQEKLKPIYNLIKEIDPSRYTVWGGITGRTWVNGERKKGEKYSSFYIYFSQNHENYIQDKEFIEKFLKERLEALKTDEFEILSLETRRGGHDNAKDHVINLFVEGKDDLNENVIDQTIRDLSQNITGFDRVYRDPNFMAKGWVFHPNEEVLSSYGLSRFDLALYIRGHIAKSNVEEFRMKGERIQVYTYFNENPDEISFEELSGISIVLPNGRTVTLSSLGEWKEENSFARIEHENLVKSSKWELSFKDDLTKKELFNEAILKMLPELRAKFPTAVIRTDDADIEAKKNKESMSKMVFICIALIFFVLALILQSVAQPLLIIMAIPFGLIGVILAFYAHGETINVMAIVGIIGMAGVVVNDSLILVDTVNHLTRSLGERSRQVIINAAIMRLRPILLTSISTLGGVLPMAYAIGGDAGFSKALALSLGWGLCFATILTLVLLPAFIECSFDVLNFWNRKFGKMDKNSVGMSEKRRESAMSQSLN
ncbi:export membrane protein [Bacteriovorax sp. BSW11_IV]|uniref:efflux RND transporter permease subunit n=1 Tax=Bacteriovorax sp. BSW11_IV TaxID=1353529 RepID=UPI00038A31EE|nr:efflux RND transporter permease subunit [Bacteriovorax sp. BSW11_IV]EQC50282.1 export membrane protein [Bacteriovorax sp. BSW11_IV]